MNISCVDESMWPLWNWSICGMLCYEPLVFPKRNIFFNKIQIELIFFYHGRPKRDQVGSNENFFPHFFPLKLSGFLFFTTSLKNKDQNIPLCFFLSRGSQLPHFSTQKKTKRNIFQAWGKKNYPIWIPKNISSIKLYSSIFMASIGSNRSVVQNSPRRHTFF